MNQLQLAELQNARLNLMKPLIVAHIKKDFATCDQIFSSFEKKYKSNFLCGPINNDNNYPLHYAFRAGLSYEAYSYLLSHDAPLDSKNNSKQTPLHAAVENHRANKELIELIFNKFAEKEFYKCLTQDGNPPSNNTIKKAKNLATAFAKKKAEIFDDPLHNSMDIKYGDRVQMSLDSFITEPDLYGNTALHFASKNCDPLVMCTLKINHTKLDMNTRNALGETPLHQAKHYLTSVYANKQTSDQTSKITANYMASYVELGGDINVKDIKGNSALQGIPNEIRKKVEDQIAPRKTNTGTKTNSPKNNETQVSATSHASKISQERVRPKPKCIIM